MFRWSMSWIRPADHFAMAIELYKNHNDLEYLLRQMLHTIGLGG